MRAAEQKFSQMRLTAVTWERRRAAGRDSWRQARVFFRVDFTVAVKHEVLCPVLDTEGQHRGGDFWTQQGCSCWRRGVLWAMICSCPTALQIACVCGGHDVPCFLTLS